MLHGSVYYLVLRRYPCAMYACMQLHASVSACQSFVSHAVCLSVCLSVYILPISFHAHLPIVSYIPAPPTLQCIGRIHGSNSKRFSFGKSTRSQPYTHTAWCACSESLAWTACRHDKLRTAYFCMQKEAHACSWVHMIDVIYRPIDSIVKHVKHWVGGWVRWVVR